MTLQTGVMSYAEDGRAVSVPPARDWAGAGVASPKCACQCANGKDAGQAARVVNGEPDFSRMTAAEKVAYHRKRWDRILG